MNRRFAFPAAASLLLAGLVLSPAGTAAAPPVQSGPQVGQWKTWVLSSPTEIPVSAPPADNSDQTKKELAELRELQSLRSPITNATVQFWNGVPATQHWTELAQQLSGQNKLVGQLTNRVHGIVGTAMYDAVVAAYNAKYTYNRRPPSQVASDLMPAASLPNEPSYPSEHAAMAGAAAGVLTYLFPNDANTIQAMAQEASLTRLLAGTNYRSDVEAGFALGQAVAEKAVARAKADGSDLKFTGTVPTGPGYWIGTDPTLATAGSFKPWVLASTNQLRPGLPPAFGSPEHQAALAEVKRINVSLTPTERAIAVFWGTMSAGIWQRVAHDLIARDNLSTPHAARVIANLGVAQWDAIIAAYEAKYTYWTIRPYQADPTIKPVIPELNFPGYPAGGPTVWTASGEVLAYFFPQDGLRLRYMAAEGTMSRLYAGVHFRFDSEAGAELGRRLAALIAERDARNGN